MKFVGTVSDLSYWDAYWAQSLEYRTHLDNKMSWVEKARFSLMDAMVDRSYQDKRIYNDELPQLGGQHG